METKKRCKVVMLPTEDKSPIFICNNMLSLHERNQNILSGKNGFDTIHQHLYVISNDEINEGDWCYHKASKTIVKYPKNGFPKDHALKVIASTDRLVVKETPVRSADSFDLTVYTDKEYIPNIHPLFIQQYVNEYNKDNKIEFIEVVFIFNTTNEDWSKRPVELSGYYTPKVDHANYIFTSHVKDSWTREEVITLVTNALYAKGAWYQEEIDEWIEKNI